MRTRFFILHNPKAGKAARRRYQRTLTLLKDQGASLECVDTGRHGEGMRVAAEAANAERFDAVVAAGGDGTVHDVATGLLGTSIPLGIIPLGTANVFAREVALRLSPGHVVSTLMRGEIHSIPLGQINGQQPVLFVVGIGFDARAVRQFEVRGTRQFGQAGFVLPLVHALLSEGHRSLQIATERGKTEAEWVIVTRGRRYAGGFLLCKEASLTQTGFHVLRFRGRGPLVRLRQLAALACGGVRFDPDVFIEHADWVRVEGDADVPVQVDGEMLGTLPVEINVHPKQLNLILPRPLR